MRLLSLVLSLCLIYWVTAGSFTMKMHKMNTNSGEIKTHITDNIHRKKFSKLSSGSQPITDYFNSIYVANITIGTPAQSFTVLLDTSSPIFYVPSATCNSTGCLSTSPGIPKKNLFDSTKSSTYNDDHVASTEYFGYGELSDDVVSIASGLSATKQEFMLATYLQDYLHMTPYDGIFGLGWNYDGTPALRKFLPALDQPIFTMFFDMQQSSPSSSAGIITYGAFNTMDCSSTINYVPLNTVDYGYWSTVFRGFTVGSYTDSAQYQAVIDSTYSGIGTPTTSYNAIMKQIGAFEGKFGGMVVLCANIAKLPNLVLTFNGINYRIPATQYVLPNDTGSPNCQVLISDTFSLKFVLGDVWLRTFCNVFDMGNKQIGFANITKK